MKGAHNVTSYSLKICLNITLSSTFMSSKPLFPSGVPYKTRPASLSHTGSRELLPVTPPPSDRLAALSTSVHTHTHTHTHTNHLCLIPSTAGANANLHLFFPYSLSFYCRRVLYSISHYFCSLFMKSIFTGFQFCRPSRKPPLPTDQTGCVTTYNVFQ
jgi:hypothetical protein